jgi:hypothetical protein
MISLSDQQLRTVMLAARTVPVEKRSQFLERVAAMLKLRGRVADDDVTDVAQLALRSDPSESASGVTARAGQEKTGLSHHSIQLVNCGTTALPVRCGHKTRAMPQFPGKHRYPWRSLILKPASSENSVPKPVRIFVINPVWRRMM